MASPLITLSPQAWRAISLKHPSALLLCVGLLACEPPLEGRGGEAPGVASRDIGPSEAAPPERGSASADRSAPLPPPAPPRRRDAGASQTEQGAPRSCEEETGSEIYERRIAPLLDESRPGSCGGCHLPGIDLASFMRGSPCTSMACLVEQRLVNFGAPEESEILRLINRGRSAEADERTQAAAELEYQGFLDWIRFSARCHHEACGLIRDPCAPPSGGLDSALPASDQGLDRGAASEDLGEVVDRRPPLERRPLERCDEPSLLRFFESRFWRWKGRCYHCHKGDGVELGLADAPTWFGDELDEAEAITVTYRRIIDRGYLNLDTPAESLLILKPLAIPLGGVAHGGGTKIFRLEEETYADFVEFARGYAHCVNPPEPDQGLPEQGAPERGAPERGAPEQGAPSADRALSDQGTPERGAQERGAARDLELPQD